MITSVYVKDNPEWLKREFKAGRVIYDRNGAGGGANRPRSDSASVQPSSQADPASPRKKNMLTRDDVFKDFDQDRRDGARGSVRFPRGGLGDSETVVSLFESSDLSTFLHESGHVWLEAFTMVATDPNVPDAMRDDLASIREWLGNDGGTWTTEQHEKWARGVEAYLMEVHPRVCGEHITRS